MKSLQPRFAPWSLALILSFASLASLPSFAFNTFNGNSPRPQMGPAHIPNCMDNSGSVLPLMDPTVLAWKKSKPLNVPFRAMIQGVFTRVTLDRDTHFQFSIQIGPNPQTDQIEVVYNKAFGPVPSMNVGMKVWACGDFINASQSSGGYSASPDGAIIHWVHLNPGDRGSKHPSGFIYVDDTLVGQEYSGSEN